MLLRQKCDPKHISDLCQTYIKDFKPCYLLIVLVWDSNLYLNITNHLL